MAVKVVVKWFTRDESCIRRIRQYFRLPNYTTINGLTPGKIDDDKMEMFKETARRGFFTYWEREWTFNGHSYSFKMV